MGTRTQRQRQEELWYRRNLGEAPGHPFYRRLNEALDEASFDEFCEARCCKFTTRKLGRPSVHNGAANYCTTRTARMASSTWVTGK
jgi:hypothetical protein